jgi:1,2-diacylglycerol 3-alpha-glucosyltransferase
VRVGLFTESYDPIINGVSTSVKTLAAELEGAGHEPVIVAPRFHGFSDENGDFPVLRLRSWRTVFNPANPMVPPPLLRAHPPAALRDVHFDVVHTQQPFGLGRHGRICAWRLGVPLISTFHTLYNEYTHYFPFLPKPATHALLVRTLRDYYNSCDVVAVPSRAAGEALRALGVTQTISVVPTGVPAAPAVIPAAVEQTRKAFSLPPGVPVLLYVGRLAREKNLDLLVDAFARLLKTEATPPILLLVGSGPYADACRRRVHAAGIEAQVRFAGFLKRDQLAPVYAAATLFVFPSSTETQGVVLSEAQSFGLPCVVVRGGGASEFVRDGIDADVIAPEAGAFAGAVRALLADGDRRRAMGQAALASPLRPAPSDMARRMIALYETACDARRARRVLP